MAAEGESAAPAAEAEHDCNVSMAEATAAARHRATKTEDCLAKRLPCEPIATRLGGHMRLTITGNARRGARTKMRE